MNRRTSNLPRFWWYATAIVLVYAFQRFNHFIFEEWAFNVPANLGEAANIWSIRFTNGAMALLLIALLASERLPATLDRQTSRPRQALLLILLGAAFAVHFETWQQYNRSAGWTVEDVGKTTIAADQLLARGSDPYCAAIDPEPGPPRWTPFDGYKYLPVTLAAYLPAALFAKSGDQGVVMTNLLLGIAAAGVLSICIAREISLDAAILCAALCFMSEVVTYELVVKGSNDIVPMFLGVCALAFINRPLVCGLLVGLAIAAKPLPGLLWIPVLLTPANPRRYFAGIALGLLPCIPFLAWHPWAMIKNTLLFAATRQWHLAAALYHAPGFVRIAAQLVVISAGLLIALRATTGPLSIVSRCACAAGLALALELSAPIMHQNYFIWWYLPMCAVFTAIVFDPSIYAFLARKPAR